MGPKLLIVGNCQAAALATCMQVMAPDLDVRGVPVPMLRGTRAGAAVDFDVDYVLYHGATIEAVKAKDTTGRAEHIRIPRIVFRGYHPDMARVHAGQEGLPGLHSAIATWGYTNGLSVDDTCSLFNGTTFERLGYFGVWAQARAQLIREGKLSDVDLAPMIDEWARLGQFMHTLNHPALRVLASLSAHYLTRFGVTPRFRHLDNLIAEPLRRGYWSTYPEIAERLGFHGEYAFIEAAKGGSRIFGLRDFVEHSFATYSQYAPESLTVRGIDLSALDDLLPQQGARAGASGGRRAHPYSHLPEHQFWSKAVAAVAAEDFDPVVAPAFTLTAEQRVATAGSCFAQHIANTLRKDGCNFLVSEAAPAGVEAEQARQRGYGLFSARFGNIYTARQLVQLFDRAYGAFVPEDSVWQRPDGRYADPFRPQVEPEGFASPMDVMEERDRHLAAVRKMFEDLEVFIFTLGLTEGWRSKRDGAVFPLAPGVAAGDMDADRYEFVNFTTAEVTADLLAFLDRLESVNPRARVLFTVSPVPLVATYENRHVLVSTTCSKAILRAAVDDVCRAAPQAAYFPSFEIITGHYNKGAYFEADLRSVTPEGVAHVMRVFSRHYMPPREEAPVALDPWFDVICDEERLEA